MDVSGYEMLGPHFGWWKYNDEDVANGALTERIWGWVDTYLCLIPSLCLLSPHHDRCIRTNTWSHDFTQNAVDGGGISSRDGVWASPGGSTHWISI
eukprot:895174-Amorphochlora_amoeboformis.AAC.1